MDGDGSKVSAIVVDKKTGEVIGDYNGPIGAGAITPTTTTTTINQSLIVREEHDGEMPATFMRNTLLIPADIDINEWLRVGETLNVMYKGHQWWIGDWLAFGERAFGEMYSQAELITGKEKPTLYNWKWVASSFPPDRRRPELTFQHHAECCALFNASRELAEEILDRAEAEDLTSIEVRYDARQALDWFNRQGSEIAEDDEPLGEMKDVTRTRRPKPLEGEVLPPRVEDLGHVEWLDDLYEIVIALADSEPTEDAMWEVRQRALEWAYSHGVRSKWPDGPKPT